MKALRGISQRVASLEQNARQPRLTMEADVPADKQTRERTERAATAVQAKHGDSCSAKRVQASPKSSTSFGVKAKLPALPRRDDVLVENGAAAPKSCLSPLEMRTPTAAGGLVPTGKISTETMTILHPLPLWFCPTEDKNLSTSTLYASYYSIIWRIFNQQAPFGPRVIETRSGQNLVFGPAGQRSSPRLPVFGNVACVALWGGFR